MSTTPSARRLSRRAMLQLTATSAGVAGLGLPVAGEADVPPGGGVAGAADAGAMDRRARPACLDLAWGRGTGLIWMAGESLFYENPRNRFMRFRRAFEVTATPQRAELRLFADTQYIAWLNGEEIGRGPGRSDPTWTYFDTYDVTARLRPGRNVLAVLALFQGFGTGGRRSIMQALLAHLEMTAADGSRTHVVSDKSWRASPAAEFIRPSPRLHATLGCMEVQDGRLAQPDWMQPGFDDSKWAASDYVKTDLVNTPWYHFVPEPLPARTLTDHPFPAAVHVAGVALPAPSVEQLGEVRGGLSAEAAAALPLTLTGGAGAQVVTLDLGRTECGYLTLDVEGPAGATIDVLCGEMLVNGVIPKPGSARVHTTRFILREGRQTLAVAFNWIAFRYAQLWAWTAQPLQIHGAVLRRLELPLGPGGHFACSDDFCNRLDAVCEHTLRLCAQDGILDSSSREQQQWIGDGRFTAISLHHRYAIGTLHRRLIEQVGQGLDWLGSMVPRYPTGNVNVSPIPLYALQWVLAFRDYHLFTGDAALLPAWWPHLRQVLRWFSAFERPDGLLERVPHWMYIDLGEEKRRPAVGVVNATLNLHYLAALRFAAAAAAAEPELARAFTGRAERLAASIRAALWDEAAGAYRDSLDAQGKLTTLSEGSNANALVHLEEPGTARAARIIDAVFARPADKPIMAGPFTMNVVFDALGRHGRADLVFPMLPARYAEQVRSGSTWEHWASHSGGGKTQPNAHSLSHAWGAGALAFFVSSVAGLRPAAPGWSAVRVAPQPGPLMRAEASVVTAAGKLAVAWERTGATFSLRVELPAGVGGSVRLPDGTEKAIPSGGGQFSCTLNA